MALKSRHHPQRSQGFLLVGFSMLADAIETVGKRNSLLDRKKLAAHGTEKSFNAWQVSRTSSNVSQSVVMEGRFCGSRVPT